MADQGYEGIVAVGSGGTYEVLTGAAGNSAGEYFRVPAGTGRQLISKAVLLGRQTEGGGGETRVTMDNATYDEYGRTFSKQLRQQFNELAQGEYLPPPYDFVTLARQMSVSPRLARCIRTFARNVVGLGFTIEPLYKIDPDKDTELLKRMHAQKDKIEALFARPNELMPFPTLATLFKTDEECTGNGYIEVVRDMTGKPARIYHVPTVTLLRRVRKTDAGPMVDGFVQIRGNKKRYFKDFRDPKVVDVETGEVISGEQAKTFPLARRASEIIPFMVYDPTTEWYGVPRWIACSPAIVGNRLSAERNLVFFQNDTVPRMIITVTGGELSQETMEQIEDFMTAKGVGEAHRTLLLQVSNTKPGFAEGDQAKIDLKPITLGIAEDAGFMNYVDKNDDMVREAFGLAPVFLQTENVNKACISKSTSVVLADGRVMTMDLLIQQYGQGGEFPVFAFDAQTQKVVVGKGHSPRVTKTAEIWELVLDNGQVLEATDDHKVLMRDGMYRQMKDLRPGDRLMNCSVGEGLLGGYRYVNDPLTRRPVYVHHLIAETFLGPRPDGHVLHHKDENKLNNAVENLEYRPKKQHKAHHQRKTIRDQYADPEQRLLKAIRQGRKDFWSDPANKKAHVERQRKSWSGEGNTNFRSDVTFGDLVRLAPSVCNLEELACEAGVAYLTLTRIVRDGGSTPKEFKRQYVGANHKVVSIRNTGRVEEVCDLTTDVYHNFALASGIFVHNSASVSREITNEQEFEPDRLEIEFIINNTLVSDLLSPEEPLVQFRFARPKLTDPSDKAGLDQQYAQMAALTVNEIREGQGKPEFPDNYLFAKKPLAIAMAEFTAGVTPLVDTPEARKAMEAKNKPPQAGPGGPEGAAEKPDKRSVTGVPGIRAPGLRIAGTQPGVKAEDANGSMGVDNSKEHAILSLGTPDPARAGK